MEYKGIDVSVYQGKIDWERVKDDGIQFAILRDGYGRFLDQKDKNFDENYRNAKAAGVPVGAYHYSYATSVESAHDEAKACLNFIKGKQLEYPVAYDVEDSRQALLSKAELTEIVRTFCEDMEKAGYYVCIYSSLSWLRNKLDMEALRAYDVWLAQWASEPTYSGEFGMWQYTSAGKVDGISGDVDRDYAYKDYEKIIKENGLNGFRLDGEEEVEEVVAGDRLNLKCTALYRSSSSKKKSSNICGTYYVYDGVEINGRYRVTNSSTRVGKKPMKLYVTGWVDKEDIV